MGIIWKNPGMEAGIMKKMLEILNIEIDEKITDDWVFNIIYKSGLGKYQKNYL